MLIYLSTIVLFGVISHAAAQNATYKLPEIARPIEYKLTIETFMHNFTFWGSVSIEIEILQSTENIILHAKNLTILQMSVTDAVVSSYATNETTDFLNITLDRNLTAGSIHTIHIEYNATLGTGNVGFYRAEYINELNQTRYLAVTHLEATNARRAFPCFDQPNYKAYFRINLIRDSELITTSNMELLQSTALSTNRIQDEYNKTVPMSTYLIAFLVADYANVSTTYNNVVYRTFGRSELILRGEGNYSVEVAAKAIEAMENFTRVPYPLSTMDQVPVPNDFYKIGAMENWGMVTYREKYLMYNDEVNTAGEKETIATIITHEFAHQWFGDLLTPEWWNYIWLNEGFATYFEMYATSQFEPTWKLMEQFVIGMVHTAFADDALETSKPMRKDVNSPDEVDGIYDTIVYEKAGSVIRMVANFLGETIFRNGLTSYLNTWQFQNVNPQLLYSSWQSAYGNNSLNITDILTKWENQSGYPVVTITRFQNGTAALNQQRFLLMNASHNDQRTWPIPIDWFTLNSTASRITWFTSTNGTLNLPNTSSQQWVIANVNQTGFYRVNYDTTNWQLIGNYLKSGNYSAIPVINRAQLVDDSFNLARSLRLPFAIALDIGSYVQNETEYIPIYAFTNAFSHVHTLATGQSHYNVVKNYGLKVLEGYFNRTGFIQQTDTHLTKYTKSTLLLWLCKLEHAACRNYSRTVFTSWINNQSAVIQPDSESFVFCNGLRESNETIRNETIRRYIYLRQDTQKIRIAQGLGCSNNMTILERLLNMTITNNSAFNNSHKLYVVTSAYTNNGADGVSLVLRWLTNNFAAVNASIGSVSSIITGVANRITTNTQLQLFSSFNNTRSGVFSSAINETMKTALRSVEYNLDWINTTSTEFTEYFGGSGTQYSSICLVLTCIITHLIYY